MVKCSIGRQMICSATCGRALPITVQYWLRSVGAKVTPGQVSQTAKGLRGGRLKCLSTTALLRLSGRYHVIPKTLGLEVV